MKFLFQVLVFLGVTFSTSAQAIDLSKVPDVRTVDLHKFNQSEFMADRRPKFCTYSGEEQDDNPLCYDGVLSQREAFVRYAEKNMRLGKPLIANNKAKENTAGLDKIINKLASVYGGTEEAIKNKEPDLNLLTAGLFNRFNNSIKDVEPYILSIAKGNYNRETLEKLSLFNNVFSNGWKNSAPLMIQYNGITEKEAENSTAYYKQEITKIRHILAQLNKYYQ